MIKASKKESFMNEGTWLMKIRRMKASVCVCVAFFCLSASSCQFLMNGSQPPDPVTVTISEPSLTLYVGDFYQLQGEASDGDPLIWSANNDVVYIEDGKLEALKEGTAKVTAHCAHAQASCEITVLPVDPNKPEETPDRTLVWHDEFDGDKLDLTKWGYQHGVQDDYGGNVTGPKYWGNNEQQYYTEDAVSVSDGMLTITATKQAMGDRSYTSGRILTRDLASFTYGYIEARIQTPAITGMWPAFWMLPQPLQVGSSHNVYGGWAKSGEIDIMEIRGRNVNVSTCALHFGGSSPNNTHKGSSCQLNGRIDEFHVYAIEWTAESITWFVDGESFFTMTADEWWTESSSEKSAPFDQPFFILLNLAVGGNFDGNRLPPDSFTSASMYVDYVRVYQYQ